MQPNTYLDGVPTAIGSNNRAIDVAGLIRSKEERHCRDVFWIEIRWSESPKHTRPFSTDRV